MNVSKSGLADILADIHKKFSFPSPKNVSRPVDLQVNGVFIIGVMKALVRAIDAAGGLTELAKRMNVKPQVISNWRKRGAVPAERVIDIEKATIDPKNGRPKVLRHDLRPDLYPEDEAA